MVFITGYSIRAPNSEDPKKFFTNLRDGVDMTSPARYPQGYLGMPPRGGTLVDIEQFDHEFFNINRKQTDKMDIAIRLLLEVTQEALMDAQISIPSLRGSRTGVYVGTCTAEFVQQTLHDKEMNGYEVINGALSMCSNRISHYFDLKGPRYAACNTYSWTCVP
mmetsp:Transcript_28542/g.43884  ORF Transcript_28542/g.43884 Transcript_28542/m.43884 type:complete len:163 (-) Transcript_28542:482-970(-)